MEIKTKYNVGDNVFTLSKELKIVEQTVKRIAIFVWPEDDVRINYGFAEGGEEYEDKCFASKEELLKYIQS